MDWARFLGLISSAEITESGDATAVLLILSCGAVAVVTFIVSLSLYDEINKKCMSLYKKLL
jgi:hypothetical protein